MSLHHTKNHFENILFFFIYPSSTHWQYI